MKLSQYVVNRGIEMKRILHKLFCGPYYTFRIWITPNAIKAMQSKICCQCGFEFDIKPLNKKPENNLP